MVHVLKCLKLIQHLIIIFIISYFVINKPKGTEIVKKINRFIPDMKHLLIWTSIPGVNDEGQIHFISNKCRHINCYFTKNRTLFSDIRFFDSVVFNLQDVSKGVHEIPNLRASHQTYIFAANDSSDNFPVCDSVYEDFFNWTWTYRSDSVVKYTFFSITHTNHDRPLDRDHWLKRMKPINETFKSKLSPKTKAAAVFLDKCESRSKREVFLNKLIEQLKIYNLSVDVYGRCGKEDCRKNTMGTCYWKLEKIYYFYLAMEDSFAEDYVTECVVYGYIYNAVPIVYGLANYEKFLPPHSYLNAIKLGEVKLAKIINNLMTNKNRYYEYFSWTNHYSIKMSKTLDACKLCKTLNNPTWLSYRVSYDRFRKWWNPNYEERCNS